MKAVVISSHGGPEVLRYTDFPKPSIGRHEVLVRVRACALNHLDLWVRRGLPGRSVPFPHILGSDISGEIAEVGENVTNARVGEKVLLAPGISCGQCAACIAGHDNFCRDYVLFGSTVHGGYAEFVKSPAANLIPIPASLSFEEAAAVPLVFLTAWHMLFSRARLRPAEEVLVIAAGSGVGSAAVQIAKVAGARVIATAGSQAKLAKAKELGADDALLHVGEFAREVKRLTHGRGVDVVFEHVGAATWDQSVFSLAHGGRLVTCGATTGFDSKINIGYLFARQLSILGSFMGQKSELFSVLELFKRGLLKPVIDCVMPLERAADAHRHLENREQFGKVVLNIP
ncbi:MAG TPA: zinc-binding dehydrogenase [Candidatus Acidoferrales bacterium]|nr:zinc-binding dehydrogenase [Candidatus Acidoferrales bacterium]